MTLKLAVEITGDQKGLKGATDEAGRDLDKLTGKAREAEAELRRVEAELERAAQAAARAANASVNTAGRINDRLGVRTDFGSAGREADVQAYGSTLDALRAKYSPLFAAQQGYLGQLREIRQAQRLGAISADEASAAITRHKAAFAAQIRGQRGETTGGAGSLSAGALAARRQNVMAQNFDVFTSLAGGMNPALVFAQQGPQYIQAYGGVKPLLEAVSKALTATRLAVLSVTGVVVAGGLAWDSYTRSTKAVETALAGVGRGSGATRSRLEELAGEAQKFGLTSGQVREMETAFLRAGDIGVAALSPALAMARDFAATVGDDVAGGWHKLTAALADPAKGAEQLLAANAIDGAAARQVQRLASQNKHYEAQIALLEAVRSRVVDADDAMSGWQKGVERLTNSLSQAWSDWGSFGKWLTSGPTREERIEQLERAKRNPRFRDDGRVDAELDRLRREQQAEAARHAAEVQARTDDRTTRVGLEAAGYSPANAYADRERELTQRRDALTAALGKPGQTADEQQRIARALDATRQALATLVPEAEKKRQLDELDLAIQRARDPVTKAELERQRALVAARGEESTASERATAGAAAYNRVIAEALTSSGTRVADLQDETRARSEVNAAVAAGTMSMSEAEEQIRIETALRPLIIAQALAEGAARDRLTQAIEAERAAMAASREEKARSSAQRVIGGQRDELAQLLLEERLIGATNAERARAIALLEAEQRIRDAGIDLLPAEANAIRANARALAERGQEVERLKAAYQDIQTVGSSAIDEATRKLADGTGGWADMITGALDDVRQQIATWAFANPLKNSLFGTNLPTMQDAGGALGRLFGGQGSAEAKVAAAVQSAATMTVTAGTVFVNGGAGVGSLIGSAGGVVKSGLPQIPGTTADGLYLPKNTGLTGGVNERVAQAFDAGGWLTYSNQAAVRNQKLDPRLVEDFAFLKDMGVRMDVFSGGQPGKGSGLPRVGSTRHDHGGAADVMFYKDGRALNYNNPADVPVYKEIVSRASANGVTGFGAGPGYMKSGSMHVGYGDAGVWGAGGKGTNAPQWLRDAAANPAAAPAAAAAPEIKVAPVQQSLDKLTDTTNQAAIGAMPALTQQTQAAATGLDGFGQGLSKALSGLGAPAAGGGGGIGDFFTKIFSPSSASVTPAVHHEGAIVGFGRGDGRRFPISIWQGADRAHDGKLLPGERPIVARDGEGIFTPKQMDKADAVLAAALAPRTVRHVVERAPHAGEPAKARALTAAPLVQAPQIPTAPASAGLPPLRVVNPPGRPQGAEVRESRTATGEREFTVVLSELAAGEIDRGGSALEKSLGQRFGNRPQPWVRGA